MVLFQLLFSYIWLLPGISLFLEMRRQTWHQSTVLLALNVVQPVSMISGKSQNRNGGRIVQSQQTFLGFIKSSDRGSHTGGVYVSGRYITIINRLRRIWLTSLTHDYVDFTAHNQPSLFSTVLVILQFAVYTFNLYQICNIPLVL